jgi:hypothetical protein
MIRPINKKQMLKGLMAGHYGNTMACVPLKDAASLRLSFIEAVQTITDIVRKDTPLAFRCFNRPGVDLPYYCKAFDHMDELYNRVLKVWAMEFLVPITDIVLYETLPFNNIMYNAELTHTHKGWHLRYNPSQQILRTAMVDNERCVNIDGLAVLLFLKDTIGETATEHLTELCQKWDNTVIEFTACNKLCGTENKNYVVWEVRTGY